jgi:hypothetical protein
MFTVVVNVDGLNRRFDTLADSVADLEKPLAIFGGWLKRRAIDRYKAQNFAPLAESTIEKRAQKGLHSLERKLVGDVKKALRNARQSRQREPQGFLARLLQQKQSLALEDALSVGTRGAQNRLAALAAFQSHHAANWGKKGSSFAERIQAKPLSIKQSISLSQREARAVMRAVGQPILGGLPRTLVVIVGAGTVTLRSATHEKWSAAHNDGATVGHGAQLVERKTVLLEDSDMEVFASILKSHMLVAFDSGLHGPGF